MNAIEINLMRIPCCISMQNRSHFLTNIKILCITFVSGHTVYTRVRISAFLFSLSAVKPALLLAASNCSRSIRHVFSCETFFFLINFIAHSRAWIFNFFFILISMLNVTTMIAIDIMPLLLRGKNFVDKG